MVVVLWIQTNHSAARPCAPVQIKKILDGYMKKKKQIFVIFIEIKRRSDYVIFKFSCSITHETAFIYKTSVKKLFIVV